MSIPFNGLIPPGGPASIAAAPVYTGILSSAQVLTGSFADVLNSGAIAIGPGGNVLIDVFASVENSVTTGHGADFQILDGASVIMPKNSSGGQPTTGVHNYNTVLVTFPLKAYETGLAAGSSHTFKFQAKYFDPSGATIVDAVMTIWTW